MFSQACRPFEVGECWSMICHFISSNFARLLYAKQNLTVLVTTFRAKCFHLTGKTAKFARNNFIIE